MNAYFTAPVIKYEAAQELLSHAMQVAESANVKAVVTIVDPGLNLVALGKSDGAPPHSLETSRRKAKTSASTRRPSGAIPPELANALEHGSGGILSSIHGGFPIVFDGIHVGGLGVAGGTPRQDAEIGQLALSKVGADVSSQSATEAAPRLARSTDLSFGV